MLHAMDRVADEVVHEHREYELQPQRPQPLARSEEQTPSQEKLRKKNDDGDEHLARDGAGEEDVDGRRGDISLIFRLITFIRRR